MHDDRYHICRKVIYAAISDATGQGIKDKLPLDFEWSGSLELWPGHRAWWGHRDHPTIIVEVKVSKGPKIANRVRVLCPVCHATWTRFGNLKQHVHTMSCKRANDERIAAAAECRM